MHRCPLHRTEEINIRLIIKKGAFVLQEMFHMNCFLERFREPPPFFFFASQELEPTWLQGISLAPLFSKESLQAQQRSDIPVQCCTTLGFIRKHTAQQPTLASFFSINLGPGKMPNVKVSLHSPSTRWRKSIVTFSGPVRNAALKMLQYILPLLLFQRRN